MDWADNSGVLKVQIKKLTINGMNLPDINITSFHFKY
jgi:hypothetical protein